MARIPLAPFSFSFTAHPASVGETYSRHMLSAFGFGVLMVGGGTACMIHAVFPFFFTTTGSRTIELLHDRMVVNRGRASRT